ncbi:antibiotic biosynthesis monooxygenase family protein [Xenorhabdus hominickii]|uniref:Antibiotic biosynthesis monooxygenase n=1 Tax=Xenorhabdus hominickii TaxID=351679 RepID=A0A2G0QA08_XENHO|nr:antibiotic biosynthesis monooxygenase family protein [Xenorhabdus hominickii]AOM40963.1 antibiotic biosynthesis monooxygenase [Xenorhabdus hominickii]PHM56060.1 antibiotic biosynthesis monooxygenase [Xenorhabdus hominickii]
MSKSEVTFINIIEVNPEKQAEIIKLLQEGTESVISKRPGFISVTLLASKDGSRVVNIAKWKSIADIQATQADPASAEFAKRTAELTKPNPGIYNVVGQYSA